MYVASVCEMHETVDENGYCTGDFEDIGEVDKITASTLVELRDKLNSKYRMNEFQEFDGRLEAQHYENNRSVLITTSIYIGEQSYTPIDALEFLKVAV